MRLLNFWPTRLLTLQKKLKDKETEHQALAADVRGLREDICNPPHRVTKAFLPALGGSGDVADQLRLALLDIERLQPAALKEQPEIAFRLCLADRYLQHVRATMSGQRAEPIEAPWLLSASGQADI